MKQRKDWVQQLDVSRETWDRLEVYAALIEKWTARINLISRSNIPMIWERHIADSSQLAGFISRDQKLWADLGSGGGLPRRLRCTSRLP